MEGDWRCSTLKDKYSLIEHELCYKPFVNLMEGYKNDLLGIKRIIKNEEMEEIQELNENFSYKVRGSKLNGKIEISGAKNSVLKLLAASILTNEKVVVSNYPENLMDVKIHEKMLKILGKKISSTSKSVVIEEENSLITDLNWDGRSIRNTLLILGGLLTRFGNGNVPLPGGCKLGERKYDIHVDIMQKMGAKIWEEDGILYAKSDGRLQGIDITLPIRSTGATENAIICGSLAKGKTTVWNPHIRPEIIDLISMLNKMGAKIEVFGQERIEIIGQEKLGGVVHQVIPDNMEAITWLIAACVTKGNLELVNFPFEHLEVPLIFLRESGAKYYKSQDGNTLIVTGGNCYPVEISTGPYPGINSDMQPLFAIYGAMSKGQSKIVDLRFIGRYKYVEEFNKMGVEFKIEDNVLHIEGGSKIKGAHVTALDLRAGAALVLAGLVGQGETNIDNAVQIERGYNNIIDKLKSVGGDIDKIYHD